VKLLKDKEGKSRKIAFLKYDNKEDMQKVLALEGLSFEDSELKV